MRYNETLCTFTTRTHQTERKRKLPRFIVARSAPFRHRDNTGGAAILRRTSHRTSSLRLSHGGVNSRGDLPRGFDSRVVPPRTGEGDVFCLVKHPLPSSRASPASVSFTRARRLSSKCLSQSSRLSFSPRAARASLFALSTFASERACARAVEFAHQHSTIEHSH